MTFVRRLILVAVLAGLTSHASNAQAAWGDLYCDIVNGSASAFQQAVNLYSSPDEVDRECKVGIRFKTPQTVTLPSGFTIDRTPPSDQEHGFAIRKCRGPNQSYPDAGCPTMSNTDVVLDVSGTGGDCPITVHSGSKVAIFQLKIIATNPSKAVCTPSGNPIPLEDATSEYAYLHDVTIVSPTGQGPDADGDGVSDASDNCPSEPNPTQANHDGDAQGDACDDDDCSGTVINDSNACTDDACNPNGGVVTHTPINVGDSNACTVDACDPVTGISHTPMPLNDGNACTTDSCNTTTGEVTHTPAVVDDANACTTDSCDPVTGTVGHVPVVVDDANACTTDSCDPATGTVGHVAIPNCPGGGVDHCAGVVPTDDGNACTYDACNPQTGATDHVAIPNCPGGAVDHCAGVVPTDDGNACTYDACNPQTGATDHVAIPNCPGIVPPPGPVPPADTDFDDDGVLDATDNCDAAANPGQEDSDGDGIGNVCDPSGSGSSGGGGGGGSTGTDTDGDGIPDDIETNTFGTDPSNPDSDGDGINDGAEVQSPFFPACGPTDPDCDDDGVCDGPNTVKDAAGNTLCAPVTEGKGDNCQLVSNGPNTAKIAPEDIQKDSDGNGIGDVCEGDMDGDTIEDGLDNCAFIPNKEQEDADANGIGNACDPGFAFSQGGSGGCGCRIDGPASKPQASLAFLTLGIPLLLLRVFRKRGTI